MLDVECAGLTCTGLVCAAPGRMAGVVRQIDAGLCGRARADGRARLGMRGCDARVRLRRVRDGLQRMAPGGVRRVLSGVARGYRDGTGRESARDSNGSRSTGSSRRTGDLGRRGSRPCHDAR